MQTGGAEKAEGYPMRAATGRRGARCFLAVGSGSLSWLATPQGIRATPSGRLAADDDAADLFGCVKGCARFSFFRLCVSGCLTCLYLEIRCPGTRKYT